MKNRKLSCHFFCGQFAFLFSIHFFTKEENSPCVNDGKRLNLNLHKQISHLLYSVRITSASLSLPLSPPSLHLSFVLFSPSVWDPPVSGYREMNHHSHRDGSSDHISSMATLRGISYHNNIPLTWIYTPSGYPHHLARSQNISSIRSYIQYVMV